MYGSDHAASLEPAGLQRLVRDIRLLDVIKGDGKKRIWPSELKKLKNMSPMSAEATVVRNYLDWMIDIPWHKKDKVDIDLNKALKVLDEDHFGLDKIKERIIEFLAVQKRMEKIKGPILCLVGHQGVGKT